MMEQLYKAIFEKWTTSDAAPARDLAKGGLWNAEGVRAGTNTNDRTGIASGELYVVVTGGTGGIIKTMSSQLEEPIIDFTFYTPDSSGLQALVQLRDRVIDLYDDATFTLDKNWKEETLSFISITRTTSGQPIKDPDEGYFIVESYDVIYGK